MDTVRHPVVASTQTMASAPANRKREKNLVIKFVWWQGSATAVRDASTTLLIVEDPGTRQTWREQRVIDQPGMAGDFALQMAISADTNNGADGQWRSRNGGENSCAKSWLK